ncbi:MAG: hypothetical protein QMC71_05750 [Gammaproteobacteria bacterium]
MNNRVAAKIIIVLLSIWCVVVVIGYFNNVTITFPFSISDGHDVPEHRLHAIRLSLMTSFVYFSIRYFFVGSVKLYPVQVLGIILFHLSVVGSLVFYVQGVNKSEYLQMLFWLPASLILYFAGKSEFKYF